MNLSIQFDAKKLPLAYRRCILSIIKDSIRRGDESLYHYYYTEQRPKPYTFSLFMTNYVLGEDEIELSGFRLNLSSSDYQFLVPFLNGLQKTKHFQYKGYQMTRGLIQYGQEIRVQSPKIVVKTRSPILVEDEKGHPLAPTDPLYNMQLNKILTKKSETLRGKPLQRDLVITPIRVKKTVVKETNETYEKALKEGKTTKPYLFFTAYHGKFMLEGDPIDLQWLLDNGAGVRSSQGFGHLQLESEVMM